ncbi:putative endo-beta-1,4-glucanase D [Podospora australis]|uniref:lytic cellulose monooxygenase (C4-dehydrogenating) n=1 Tax=Podospora australis TaxID=1536484 RepID=A0AAN6X1L8_9PEZI|nr:putative endo-beta-1,4-glucanase D [Podospora australis]
MRFPLLFSLGLATTSTAHTVLTTLFVNDVNQGDGTCIRMSNDPERTTFPIGGINSPDMACGANGNKPVKFTCPTPAGAKLTFAFRAWADDSSRGAIDKSHVGSIAVYLKQVSDMSSTSASGSGWFKIWDSGYDTSTKKWSAEKLIDQHGLLSINLPSGLPKGGYFLARTEVLALQNVTDPGIVSPQFFVGCAQLFISSSSSSSLNVPSGKSVSIPGHVASSHPGLNYNIYENDPNKKPYPVIGPAAFFPTSSSSSAVSSAQQQSGAIPATCLAKNANWCASEVPDYSTENECWAASDNCWRQLDTCYNSAPPSGSKGCRTWQDLKCEKVQAACRDKNWKGPQNKGKRIGDGEKSWSEPIPGGSLPGAENRSSSSSEGEKPAPVVKDEPATTLITSTSAVPAVSTAAATTTKVAAAPVVSTSAAATATKGSCKGRRQQRRRLAE